MEIEHLTKQQIVLVTLLVSFVSSIASGIVTVSLLDQAPPAVTQTINRVVEKTVERVVTDPSTGGNTVVKETVIVSEDEAVVNALDIVGKSVVRIADSNSAQSFFGFGVVVSSDGGIIGHAPRNLGTYYAKLPNGVYVPMTVVRYFEDNDLVLFKASSIANSASVGKFADISKLKLGQKVVALGGVENNSVSSGIVSSIISPQGSKDVSKIQTNIAGQVFAQHAVLINLSGEIVGLKVGADVEDGFVPSNILQSLLK